MKEYFQLIDFWTRLCTCLFCSTILYYKFFLALRPTGPTFIFLHIIVNIDTSWCIMYVFYQLLFMSLHFKFLSVIFNSLAAAELYGADNTWIKEYGSLWNRSIRRKISVPFLDTFVKLRKASIIFIVSLLMKQLVSGGWIFVKFDNEIFSKMC